MVKQQTFPSSIFLINHIILLIISYNIISEIVCPCYNTKLQKIYGSISLNKV